MIRDRDGAFGLDFSRRVKGLGTKEIKTAIRAPLMNSFAERVIGTFRRECFDHLIVWSGEHARRLLASYVAYYNSDRTHMSLDKDAPDGRAIEPPVLGKVISLPRVGGLHHRHTRIAA